MLLKLFCLCPFDFIFNPNPPLLIPFPVSESDRKFFYGTATYSAKE